MVTTGYRGFADYVVRDMTLTRVSLSKSMQSPKHCIQPGINTNALYLRIISTHAIHKCVIMQFIYVICNYDCVLFLQSSDDHDGPFCLKQFQYTGWPDHGVPCQSSSLVKFIQHVRKEFEGTDAPIVVHCR